MRMQKLTAVVAFLGAANAYTLTTDVVSRSAMRTSSRIYMAIQVVGGAQQVSCYYIRAH